MKRNIVCTWIYGMLGAVLALAVGAVCVWMRDTPARLVSPTHGAAACTEGLFSRICAGDYAGASEYLYGSPQLDSGQESDGGASRQIWDAFTSSLEYELVGDVSATAAGISQNVRFRGLEIASVTGNLRQRAEALLALRVDEAGDMEEVYDEHFDYRADFLDQVLRDAAEQAIAEDGRYAEQELTVNLVYDWDRWWVVPDAALLGAISGGILGNV